MRALKWWPCAILVPILAAAVAGEFSSTRMDRGSSGDPPSQVLAVKVNREPGCAQAEGQSPPEPLDKVIEGSQANAGAMGPPTPSGRQGDGRTQRDRNILRLRQALDVWKLWL